MCFSMLGVEGGQCDCAKSSVKADSLISEPCRIGAMMGLGGSF